MQNQNHVTKVSQYGHSKSQIMTLGNRLYKTYGHRYNLENINGYPRHLTKSQSLQIAHMYVTRLSPLQNELFLLQQKDRWTSQDNTRAAELTTHISGLRARIYPRKLYEYKFVLQSVDIDRLKRKIKNADYDYGPGNPTSIQLNLDLKNGYQIYTSETFDTDAYKEVLSNNA